jgi:pimeloyl-ACP methyl ester carboxylesterase
MFSGSRSLLSIGGARAARGRAARVVLALFGLTAVPSCVSRLAAPDLGGLYNRAAQDQQAEIYRNPVIVIPGILGTRLKVAGSDRLVWGAFGGRGVDPRTDEGARLTALPIREGASLADLTDDVVTDGVLDRVEVSIFGLPIELQAYMQILGTLGAGGYRDEQLGVSAIDYGNRHFTCFQFAYDWRRDNVENAKRLKQFILEKRDYVRGAIKEQFGVDREDIQFDIIAHSMGGLVTRYFLRYGDQDLPADGSDPELTWEGANYVDRVILVGTPSSGSVHAIQQLVSGIRFAPIFPKYEAAILDTFPSIYQLLPRTRHGALVDAADRSKRLDIYDPALWESRGWGLADPEEDRVLEQLLPDEKDPARRRAIALDHLRKCLDRARRFNAALDKPAAPPAGVEVALIAGDAVATPAVAAARADGGVEFIEHGPGDGTVLRSSALADERVGGPWSYKLVTPVRWTNVQFLFTDHLGMTKDPAFSDNVLYRLLEEPR